mgnify:CR=1 FL=1
MKKVCIYCEKWGSGGIEAFLVNVLEHMDLSVLHVDIVTAAVTSSLFFPRLAALHITILELSGNPYRLLKNHRLFRTILKEKRYDVIHVNAFIAVSCLYLLQAKRNGIPKRVLHSHNTCLCKSASKPLKAVFHAICKYGLTAFATDLWACSEEAAGYMFPQKLRICKPVEIVPDGIDTKRFSFSAEARVQARKQLNISDRFVIGNVGRICYQKNQEFLFDVLSHVRRYRADAILLLVGDGETDALRAKAAAQGLSNHVIFYGTSIAVESLLCAMDVFVFPSHFEGFGIVAVEAQCTGLDTFCSREVPLAVNITPRYHRLSLAAGAAQWADTILDTIGQSPERCSYSREVSANGYDIAGTAAWIYQHYTEQATEQILSADHSH